MDDRLIFLISRTQHLLKEYLKAETLRSGLNLSQAQTGILLSLEKSNGLQMNALARILSVDNALITRHVDFLEKEGLVKRAADPEDRRRFNIEITKKGLETASAAVKTAKKVNDMIKDGFSDDEIETFKKVLNSFFIKFSVKGDHNGQIQ